MKKIYRLFVCSCLILCAFCITQAQSRNLSTQYKQVRDPQGDHLIISGETDFPVSSVTVSAIANRASGSQTLTIPAPTVTPIIKNLTEITGAKFSLTLDYGAGGQLADDLESLIVESKAQPSSATTSGTDAITNRMKIDMQFVNQVRRLLTVNADISPIAPVLSVGAITVLDNAVFLRVNSNIAVRVKASAFRTGVSPTIIASSDEIEIPSNGSALLKISPLTADTPFQIKVTETSPHPGRTTAEELPVVADLSGTPLRTRATIAVPSVTFQTGGDIKVVNNRSLTIPLTVTNASRIRMTLEAQNDVGVFTPVENPKIELLSVPTNSPQTVNVKLSLLQTTLDSKTPYRIRVEGLTQFDEANPGPAILSNTFKGLGALLTKGVDLEFTSQGIKFLADTNQTPAKLEVKVGSTPQSFSYSASTASGNPTFLLTFDALKSALGTQAANDARLPLTIGVRAEDGSEREQVFSIAIKISPTELSSKPSGTKAKIASFVQEIRSDPNLDPDKGKSIKVGDIIKTGLSVLLRFLVPIP